MTLLTSGSIVCKLCVIPSTKWLKCSNCTVNSSNLTNQEICFHGYQAHLIYHINQDQIPLLLMQMIQYRFWVRPRYFIKWMRPIWTEQNVTQITQLTWMTWPSFKPVSYYCYEHTKTLHEWHSKGYMTLHTNYMWLYFTKASFHAHNRFSPSLHNSCTH